MRNLRNKTARNIKIINKSKGYSYVELIFALFILSLTIAGALFAFNLINASSERAFNYRTGLGAAKILAERASANPNFIQDALDAFALLPENENFEFRIIVLDESGNAKEYFTIDHLPPSDAVFNSDFSGYLIIAEAFYNNILVGTAFSYYF